MAELAFDRTFKQPGAICMEPNIRVCGSGQFIKPGKWQLVEY